MRVGLAIVLAAQALMVSAAASGSYRAPRTAEGHPDLQGTWDQRNLTPLVRPAGFPAELSAEQARALEKMVHDFLDNGGPSDPTIDIEQRELLPVRGTLRSSIVVDPPDGQLPGTPRFYAELKQKQWQLMNGLDGPEQRPTSERCLGSAASQAPILHNPGINLHQIVQTANTVLFFSEAMHDARVIRLNAKHAPAAVTSWAGDSIGWWEGETLVVETKHFTASDTGRTAPFVAYFVSPRTTVIERITRVSENELDYEFTVEDPTYYTRPWSGQTHLQRSHERTFEYSCHEGNRSLPYILQARRLSEAEPKDGPPPAGH